MASAFDSLAFQNDAFELTAAGPVKELAFSISNTETVGTTLTSLSRGMGTLSCTRLFSVGVENGAPTMNYVTSSLSTTAGRYYIASISYYLPSGATILGGGVTWTLLKSLTAGQKTIYVWGGFCTSSTTGAITFGDNGFSMKQQVITIDELTNVGRHAVVTAYTTTQSAASITTNSVTGLSTPQTDNNASWSYCSTYMDNTTAVTAINATAGWTSLGLVSTSTSGAVLTQFDVAYQSSASNTWATQAFTSVGSIIVEISGGTVGYAGAVKALTLAIAETLTHSFVLDKTTSGGPKDLAFSIAEVEAYTTSFNRTRASIFPIIETETFVSALRRLKPIASTIAETTTLAQALKRTRLASFTIAETEAIVVAYGKLRGLAFSISEVNATLYTLGRSRIAALNIAESIADALVLQRSRVAGLSIAETIAYAIDLSKSGPAGGPKDLALAIAQVETMVIAESVKRGLVFTELETQSIVIATIARARKLVEAVSETTGMTNAIARNRGVVTNITETTGMTASLNRLKGIALALAETYSYSFSVVKVKLLTSSITELETFSFGSLRRTKQIAEAISEVINHSATFNRTRTSSVTISELETVQEALRRVREVQETISQLETVTTSLARQKQIATTVAELETLTIELSKQVITLKLLAMAVTETETVSMLAGRVRNLVYNSLNDGQGSGGVGYSNTNLLTNPGDVGLTPWTVGGANTITQNAIANPLNGAIDVEQFADNSTATSALRGATQNITGATSGSVYTVSFYAKANGRDYIKFINSYSTTNAIFSLIDGTVTGATNCTTSSVNVGGGWWRCIVTFTSTSTSISFNLRQNTTSAGLSYAGVIGSGLYVYGSKVELGSVASDYILTAATSNGEYETIVASFNRSRAFIVPIGETENFTLNFGRMRTQLMNITETQGVSAAFARIRTLLQDIANTTNYSFTIVTTHGFGGKIKVTVTWTEWVTDGIYQKQVNRSEEILCVAASGSDHSVQTSDGSTVVIPDAEFSTLSVITESGTFTVVPTNSV